MSKRLFAFDPDAGSAPVGAADLALARLDAFTQQAGAGAWELPEHQISDTRVRQLAQRFGLTGAETLALALLALVETSAAAARRVAQVQAPVGGARPLAGLLATLFAQEGLDVSGLRHGALSTSGLVQWGAEAAPLPERSLALPDWLAVLLSGHCLRPDGISLPAWPAVHLGPAVVARARAFATALAYAGQQQLPPVLLILAGCMAEAGAMAQCVATELDLAPVVMDAPPASCLAGWIHVAGALPILCAAPLGTEVADKAPWLALDTPLIIMGGANTRLDTARPVLEWRAGVGDEDERAHIWQAWGLRERVARQMAARYRQSAGRIAEIGRRLDGGATLETEDVVQAVMAVDGRMEALARRSHAEVKRQDVIVPDALGKDLDRLCQRVLLRNRLPKSLGPTLAARYRPGVRALLTGESGTGKTLAAHWLAGATGLPLHRVDLSSLISKWIGETEKNLSELLDAAEEGDVLLFFDEADSLFGARTDVSDAHDRHANAQTNFLLQRIEDFAGVALLATNNRDRFDPAFVRRIDMVLEFPLPDASARRALWQGHLGDQPMIGEADLDALAAEIELAGGHVRNIALAAMSCALSERRPLCRADLTAAALEEYRKLGRTPPVS